MLPSASPALAKDNVPAHGRVQTDVFLRRPNATQHEALSARLILAYPLVPDKAAPQTDDSSLEAFPPTLCKASLSEIFELLNENTFLLLKIFLSYINSI